MPCYHPVRLVRPKEKHGQLIVPCGRCYGCRLEYSRIWAVRCYHESMMHKSNAFVTLTYDEKHLPYNYMVPTLVPRDLQLFFKRLRKEFGDGIRYYACGEYGELNNRPHYHACIFGIDFQDKILDSVKNGNNVYSSASLNRIWGRGMCAIGDVTFESAAYVARYLIKKRFGKGNIWYSQNGIEAEFVRMSRGCKKLGTGGIGKSWYDKYKTDVYNHDQLKVRGKTCRAPRYYDKKFELENPEEYAKIKEVRKKKGEARYWKQKDLGAAPLSVQERVKIAQTRTLKREL